MNPQSSNEQPGFNLPPPHTELFASPSAPEGSAGLAETGRNGSEKAPAAGQQVVSAGLPMPPSFATNAVGQGTGNDVTNTTTTVAAITADDGDLIEKEWVNKAKAIVEKTQNDPYQQSKELNFLRAGYMQKRYSKIIKLSE